MRESFIIYRSFYALIRLLSEKKQLRMFTAIFDFGLDEKEPVFKDDETMTAIWSAIKPQLNANNKRFTNSLKGGAPKGNSNAKKQPNDDRKNNLDDKIKTTEKQPNENDNENENVNDNENERDKRINSFSLAEIFPNLILNEEVKLSREEYLVIKQKISESEFLSNTIKKISSIHKNKDKILNDEYKTYKKVSVSAAIIPKENIVEAKNYTADELNALFDSTKAEDI